MQRYAEFVDKFIAGEIDPGGNAAGGCRFVPCHISFTGCRTKDFNVPECFLLALLMNVRPVIEIPVHTSGRHTIVLHAHRKMKPQSAVFYFRMFKPYSKAALDYPPVQAVIKRYNAEIEIVAVVYGTDPDIACSSRIRSSSACCRRPRTTSAGRCRTYDDCAIARRCRTCCNSVRIVLISRW